VLAVSAAVDSLPLVATDPVQPCDAVQEVAFVEVHVSVLLAPDCTVVGAAVNVTVGAGGPEEPPPEHAARSEAEARRAKRTRDSAIRWDRELLNMEFAFWFDSRLETALYVY
jgi:hypothetical protein